MIRVVIVDDETFARESLSKLLSVFCPEVSIVGTANSVKDAVEVIEKYLPELVFLDIHLAKEISFSIIEQLTEVSFSIIFTSGHSNYGIEAFKVNAIDYLLKPIDSDDLVQAVQKYVTWKQLNQQLHQSPPISIKVHGKNHVTILDSKQIISLVANDNYTTIFTLPDQKHTTAKTLKEIEAILKPDSNFIRIHHGVIINTLFVESYSKLQPYLITMSNGSVYEISRRKRAEVIAVLK